LKADQEKRVEVDVVSAYALSESVQKTLAESLKKRLQREVNLNTSVDRSLIGGLVIHAGDMVIDGSVRGRLNKLAETIKA
jgi:F-type H+-transporting ATPase subunit delta